ncbi:MAG: hypothetical protein HYY44_08795 [Deltaproteobacteria bacterium]|nr:hypothetical protein [Deltaproteobacteria bacterium]
MSTARGVLAAGVGISVVHLIESAYDIGAAKSPENKDVSFSYRKVDGFLGAAASAFSIVQTSAIFAGKFHAARTVSAFALGFAATQLLIGGIAYSQKEPGHNGTDLLLAGLQVASVVSGFSYARYSLPALVAMAGGRGRSNDQALTKLYMRWYEHSDPAAAQALSRIAVTNPYRFAANHSGVLFSGAIDDASARIVLSKLLDSHTAHHNIVSVPLLGVAIESRPALFRASDVSKLLTQLRISNEGPLMLDKLMVSRPDLAMEVFSQSEQVFRKGDWKKFGDLLRKIWVWNLGEAQRAEYLYSWRSSLLIGLNNHRHPVRDLWKVVDRANYGRFLAEFIETMDEDQLRRAATPLLEDLVRTSAEMERIGLMVADRSDVDLAAFDFLWEGAGPQGLRQRALRLLADRASGPHIMKAEAPIMSVTVDGVRQMFGTRVLRGWFKSRDQLVQWNLPALTAVLKEPGYSGNPVLQAIARLHRLDARDAGSGGISILS